MHSPVGMTPEHKEALARGRAATLAVRAYLEALGELKTHRTRPRREELEQRIASIQQQLANATSIQRLHLSQQRLDLEAELQVAPPTIDLDELERNFVKHAARYSTTNQISYTAWRENGVRPAVLKAAGIARTRRPTSR
jgi:DNA-binding protein H-NS